MGGMMIMVDPRNGSEVSESPPRNLVKDGPRELLKQKIEKMQTRAAEKMALKNAHQFEEYFLKLAQQYFDFDVSEYRELSCEEKKELFEVVRSRAQKRMRSALYGNGIFVGGVIGLSLALSPFFLCGLVLLVFDIPIFSIALDSEIDFLMYKRYAGYLPCMIKIMTAHD